jgi:head-tail adaptor
MFDDLLVQRCLVQEASIVRTGSGEVRESWSDSAEGTMPCLVRFARMPADIPPGVESGVTHVIYVRRLAVGERTLRVVVDGVPYRVIEAKDPGARGHHHELLCRREGPSEDEEEE